MKAVYRALGLGNKLLNHVEERMQRTKLISSPVVVDVVLTKACNFACSFCKDYETPATSKRISIDNFQRLAKQVFPTASRLDICSGGEPYLHTGLTEILRIAKQYDLYTWVLSNGSVMKPKIVEAMISEQLISGHGFSVDGYRAQTVEAIRKNASLPVILDNIRMVLRMRESLKKKTPSITIRYALMRSNIEELADAVRQWGDMGVDHLECGYLSLANDMDPDESLYFHQDLMKRCVEDAQRVAERFPNLKLTVPAFVDDEKKRLQPDNCNSPWKFVMVDTNGQIMPCYRSFEALRFPSVYDPAEPSFRTTWNSSDYQQLRRTVNNDSTEKFYPYCGQCENRCGWGSKDVHLGDEHWLQQLGKQWVDLNINHKRPERGRMDSSDSSVVARDNCTAANDTHAVSSESAVGTSDVGQASAPSGSA